jgi:hypothetical protein
MLFADGCNEFGTVMFITLIVICWTLNRAAQKAKETVKGVANSPLTRAAAKGGLHIFFRHWMR